MNYIENSLILFMVIRMDLIVSRTEIKEYEKLKIISELSLVKEKLQLFESKYNCSFEDFEKQINHRKQENFTEWDDFIEWKAYFEKKAALTERMEQVADVQNIRIAEDS